MATGSRTRSRASKAEQAAATRERIVVAATELFLTEGFLTSTMAAIAKRAGVAVQTLYLAFGSKTAILQATLDAALRAGGDEDIPDQDWYRSVLEDDDGPAALRRFCIDGGRNVQRAAPLYEVVRAASSDPEVADVLASNKRLRAQGFAAVVEALAGRAGFAPDLTTSDALAILYTVFSEDTFLLMVTERGWTPEQWMQWCSDTVRAQFFPAAA